ncbi:MAG: flagellar protein FlgN [Pseudomonas sp.]|uniref:flagella synthesis protein FlgN n=1 Tax=Pseudomonas sp. TaxID=306 RepID=UPI0030F34CBF
MHDKTLLDLFNEDIGTASQLLELIDAEFQALTDRDLPLLETILANKQPLLAVLAQHGGERNKLLSSLNLSPDQSGLTALAEQSPIGSELLERGGELSALLERCQTANTRNGRLIRINQASVGGMLGILRGNSDTPGLYDSRGGAARIGHQRPLSQA